MGLHDRILVATDLSAQSDRAFDRAVSLARRDGANLVVLHVVESHHARFAAVADDVRAKLAFDLGAADRATIRIEEGNPAAIIDNVAREEGSTLVVAGAARGEQLGSYTLGSTTIRLARRLDAPLLLVSERPRGPYSHVAVTTDFSAISRRALEVTAREFPYQPITAFHAYEPLAAYGASNIDIHREQYRRAAELEFLAWRDTAALPPRTREHIRPQIVFGEPARRLHAEAGSFDLVVIATHGRGRIFEFFVGSVAMRMLAELPCDALLLRIRQVSESTALGYTSELT